MKNKLPKHLQNHKMFKENKNNSCKFRIAGLDCYAPAGPSGYCAFHHSMVNGKPTSLQYTDSSIEPDKVAIIPPAKKTRINLQAHKDTGKITRCSCGKPTFVRDMCYTCYMKRESYLNTKVIS